MEAKTLFRFQIICLICFLVIGLLISYLTGNILYLVVIPLPGFLLPKIVIAQIKKKRLKKFEKNFMDALDMISNALKSGKNFEDALEVVANDAEKPVNQEFSLLLDEVKEINVPIKQALLNLYSRVPLEDVKLMVSSINIILEMGKGIRIIFDSVADLIKNRSRIERKIKMLTAQMRFQGTIISIVPAVFASIMYFVDPETIQYLFNTNLGKVCIGVIILLQISGFIWIKKITKIEV